MAILIEQNIITNIVQVVTGILLIVSFWLGYKQYVYQKMESTIKANTQIRQNQEMIVILGQIRDGK